MLLNVAVTEYIFEGIFVILMFYIVRKARKTVYLLSKLERESENSQDINNKYVTGL